MPKRNVNLRIALRTPERGERQHEANLAALRAAIDEGDASGIAKGNAFDRVRKTLGLCTKRR
jgi:Arc/MetJ-type ribon-helix-helix transcriptional regulator